MKKILVIFLILIGLYWVFTNWVEFDWLPFGRSEQKAAVTEQTDLIEINVSSLSTTIIPEERDDLKAELTGRGTVRVDRNGDKIIVTAKQKWFNFFSFGQDKLKIYIPKNYQESIAIDLGSGNLDFSGQSKRDPMTLANLAVDLGSGNMKLSNLEVKHFKHDGSSGNVNIQSLTTKTGDFEISSGSLNIEDYTGQLNAELSSGKLSIEMAKLVDDVNVEVSSGTVDLDLPENASFKLNGKSSSGNISCNFPLTSESSNTRSLSGKHGSGKHNIDLTVSSGNIRVH
ncbi:DUF4097 domain-containing protein [Bacillus sp. DNRA2]|uniref:LiaG family protein n=1 Tax=Bacillus sp. DNRA2 TaxID=2723053 RepID=UPI00145F9901|nr:DUF4097 domain-containing protein [Bacillus sp. DNRA2]NMD69668.1 DUF4097 domain-containing protein [Bacillus sp. DNRA2]